MDLVDDTDCPRPEWNTDGAEANGLYTGFHAVDVRTFESMV